jgi:hypothetical protein
LFGKPGSILLVIAVSRYHQLRQRRQSLQHCRIGQTERICPIDASRIAGAAGNYQRPETDYENVPSFCHSAIPPIFFAKLE